MAQRRVKREKSIGTVKCISASSTEILMISFRMSLKYAYSFANYFGYFAADFADPSLNLAAQHQWEEVSVSMSMDGSRPMTQVLRTFF